MTLPSPWLGFEWGLIFLFINPQPRSAPHSTDSCSCTEGHREGAGAVWVEGVSTAGSLPSSPVVKSPWLPFWVNKWEGGKGWGHLKKKGNLLQKYIYFKYTVERSQTGHTSVIHTQIKNQHLQPSAQVNVFYNWNSCNIKFTILKCIVQ